MGDFHLPMGRTYGKVAIIPQAGPFEPYNMDIDS